MKAEKVITYLLTNDSALNAVVADEKIYPGYIPLNTALPAIAYNSISAFPTKEIGMSNMLKTVRIEVTVQTKSYSQQKSVMQLIRAACDAKQGTISGVDVDSCLADLEGPDMRDDDAGIYMQTQDFIIKFRE